jgi:hypothetical protein
LANLLTMQIRLDYRRPVRKLKTWTERASQLILPKQYLQDLGVIVSRLLEENVSRYLILASAQCGSECHITSSNTLSICSQPDDHLQPVFSLILPQHYGRWPFDLFRSTYRPCSHLMDGYPTGFTTGILSNIPLSLSSVANSQSARVMLANKEADP